MSRIAAMFTFISIVVATVAGWSPVCAGAEDAPPPAVRARPQDTPPPSFLSDIGIDQKLDEQVPLDLVFRNEKGESVRLGDLLHPDRPAVLLLVYFECPMLCTMALNDITGAMKMVPLTAGKEFDIITVSFDPRESHELAAAKKRSYLKQYGRPEAEHGWHFLVGDQEPIKTLTDAVGFRYVWDDATKQFAHASGFMILTPTGRIARYFYGHNYAPTDLRLSLVEASQGKIGSPADAILLYCFHYDPAKGKYSLAIMNLLRAAGVVTLVLLVGFIWRSARRDGSAAAVAARASADQPSSGEQSNQT